MQTKSSQSVNKDFQCKLNRNLPFCNFHYLQKANILLDKLESKPHSVVPLEQSAQSTNNRCQ